MESSPTKGGLSELQRAVLAEFFRRERGFFLTGGGALVGYYLHHRTTSDLDLFTLDENAFERSRYVLGAVAEAVGANLDVRQDAPDFRRYGLSRAGDAVLVDLVRERVRQVGATKREIDGVLVDTQEEILANKLTALVGRQEERDLVDVYYLEKHGFRVEDALDAALAKDGGCTPATLAWLLSEIRIDDAVSLPGGIAPDVLRAYVGDLVKRLRRRAAPC
jgi:predicted nucleotidyltransferase component of viral defense system